MVSFSRFRVRFRQPRELRSEEILDEIIQEAIHFVATIILILTCMAGCYVMVRIIATSEPVEILEDPVEVPILFGSNNREICKKDRLICLNLICWSDFIEVSLISFLT